ncbi:DNA damage-binding protein 2-like isoform X2 [Panicum virgatum]|uniref:DNA damage-binding protein 2-like isoform X2 n=1 Tax=Panicum virgatum TaxID=38727 RepID=UPI0019D580AE|nr:DNA damage-binding protein 2-like isoform X2 [Panicum virgatum]
MGPTTRAQFVYNRRRRSGGRHAVEEASDEEEQRQDSSSSSSDEEDEAEASGEEVADEEEEEAAAVEPAVKEDHAAAAAGEKRGGRKGRITISLKKVCKVCKKTGHEAGFKGAVYIDCPMKPCFLCKMPGHTTLTCPHRVAMEHGVIPAPRRNTNTSLDYVFQSQVKGKISMKGLLGIWDYVKLHEKITYDSVHFCILNSMKIDNANDGILYTASSDGTISCTDLDTGMGSPLLNLNPNGWNGPSSWRMIYGMDLNTDKGLILVADNFGFLYFLDRRSKTRIGHPVLIHKKGSKVTTLHCSPARPEVLLSSGNDHYARIWDTRKLEANSPLANLAHGRVVNSGYFSPQSGNKILTTCQDNRIRVWDYIFGDLQSPSREIVHSHDFNRHLTPFKAEWDPKDYTETVAVVGRYISENYNGVALHPIDFIDTSSGKLLAEVMDPDITTISPVNKLHPQDDILATGSSRSIFIWKPKTEDELTEERTKQKAKEYIYGSGSRKKTNGKHDNSSDDDSDGDSGRKSKKAKKTRFTCTTKGKGKSKV